MQYPPIHPVQIHTPEQVCHTGHNLAEHAEHYEHLGKECILV